MPKRRQKGRRPHRRRNMKMSSFGFNASQSEVVRGVQFGFINTNGSGVCSGVIPFDPTSSHLNVLEFTSDWANLWTQYRLRGIRIHFYSAVTQAVIETKSANLLPLAIGFQWRSTASLSTPTAYNTVLDNQPSQCWNVTADTSPRGFLMTQRAPPILTFLETNATTSPGNQGAPGGIQFYGDTFTPSITIASYWIEVFYQMRSRS